MEYRAYKDRVRLWKVTLSQPCKVIFHIPMPESWSVKKKQANDGQPHLGKPDVDNLAKGLLDALYEDDAHIWSIWAEKRWAFTGAIEVSD